MTQATPTRRPIRLATNGITQTLERCDAAKIDLGIAALKADMNAAGWRTSTPADDLADRTRTSDGQVIDYADPTGDLALIIERCHEDLCEVQDIHRRLEHDLRRLAAITGRYVPTTTGEPVCSRNGCDDVVERNGSGGFRDCVMVAGIWCTRPGAKPMCARHRKADQRREREEAAARAELETGVAS